MIISIRQAATAALIATALIMGGCGSSTSTSSPEVLLASAKDYLVKNDNKSAIIQLKNALQSKPNLAEARFLLGKVLFETGDPSSAEKELRKALELNYPAEQVIPPLARSLVLLGQHKKVIDEFGKADVSDPQGRAEVQTAIGQAQLALRQVDAARAAFTAALAAQPKHVPAQIGQARVAAIRGDLGNALAILDSVLVLSAGTAEAWHVKGHILTAQGDTASALAAYRKLVELRPDFLPGHEAILGTLMRENKTAEATKQLEALKQVAPKYPVTLYFQALLAYRQKNYTAAQSAIQEQMRILPDYLPGLVLAGAIDMELKAYAQAEVNLLKVLQRNPNAQQARRMLIATYVLSNQPSKALEALKPVLHTIGKDAGLLALAGEVYMMNGEPGQAAEYFAKASALDPGDARKRTSLALSHMAKGETEKAFSELELSASAGDDVRADLALIAAHMQRRRYDKALAAIAMLEKKRPESPLPSALRGDVLLGKKDRQGARRSFERAIEIDPTYFPAIASLAKLDFVDNKPDAGRQRFEAIVARDPKHLEALLALAELRAREAGASSEVAGLINKAVAAHPTNSRPRLALVGHYLYTREPKRAVRAAQDALAAIPDRPEIIAAAARAFQVAGDANQALSMYDRLASLQPTSPEPHLLIAQIHVALNNKERAFDSLRAALKIRPDLLEAQRGIIALNVEGGRRQEAIAVAQEVQKQRPNQSVGYIFEGDIHMANKGWPEAAAAYRRGLRKSDSTDLAVKLHNTLVRAGSRAEAEQFAATWLKAHPKDDAFRTVLAQKAMVGKDYATAAQIYRKLLDTHPDNPMVLNSLAWTSGQLKDPKATEYAERAHKLAPDNPAIMDTLGVLLIENGETARSLELLRKATAMAPQSPGIRLNLAKALIKAGQKEAARKELDELSKLGARYSHQAEVAQLKAGL